MNAGQVKRFVDGAVGWLVLHNPHKRNAISLEMWKALTIAILEFQNDGAVRCIVIRGDGDTSFCAGADVGEKQGVGAEQAASDAMLARAGLNAVEDCSKPVLAMINGYCLGAGMALALACDLRFAGTDASIGIPAAKLGLPTQYSSTKRLVDVVGPSNAKFLVFTADRISAEKALAIGLVNEVFANTMLDECVLAIARRIAANAPLTVTSAKHAVAAAVSEEPGRNAAELEQMARECLSSEDYIEGRRAFREKRPPVFVGR